MIVTVIIIIMEINTVEKSTNNHSFMLIYLLSLQVLKISKDRKKDTENPEYSKTPFLSTQTNTK